MLSARLGVVLFYGLGGWLALSIPFALAMAHVLHAATARLDRAVIASLLHLDDEYHREAEAATRCADLSWPTPHTGRTTVPDGLRPIRRVESTRRLG